MPPEEPLSLSSLLSRLLSPPAPLQQSNTSKTLFAQPQSAFERLLHVHVNEPLLSLIPLWVDPNSISYVNGLTSWLLLLVCYVGHLVEGASPLAALLLRLLSCLLIFATIVLDCLDGLQARRTKRTSNLGEVLDHSLDAANAVIMCGSMMFTLDSDVFNTLLSLLFTGIIYNAQLVLFRHAGTMVIPPISGPDAQMLTAAAQLFFALFFFFVPRSSSTSLLVVLFLSVANLSQFSNIFFFWRHLRYSFGQDMTGAHLRYVFQVVFFSFLCLFGLISKWQFVLCGILLSYRLNGQYLVVSIVARCLRKEEEKSKEDEEKKAKKQGEGVKAKDEGEKAEGQKKDDKKDDSKQSEQTEEEKKKQKKEAIKKQVEKLLVHTDKEWNKEILLWFFVILLTGTSSSLSFLQWTTPFIPFLFSFHLFLENVRDLITYKPVLIGAI